MKANSLNDHIETLDKEKLYALVKASMPSNPDAADETRTPPTMTAIWSALYFAFPHRLSEVEINLANGPYSKVFRQMIPEFGLRDTPDVQRLRHWTTHVANQIRAAEKKAGGRTGMAPIKGENWANILVSLTYGSILSRQGTPQDDPILIWASEMRKKTSLFDYEGIGAKIGHRVVCLFCKKKKATHHCVKCKQLACDKCATNGH